MCGAPRVVLNNSASPVGGGLTPPLPFGPPPPPPRSDLANQKFFLAQVTLSQKNCLVPLVPLTAQGLRGGVTHSPPPPPQENSGSALLT